MVNKSDTPRQQPREVQNDSASEILQRMSQSAGYLCTTSADVYHQQAISKCEFKAIPATIQRNSAAFSPLDSINSG